VLTPQNLISSILRNVSTAEVTIYLLIMRWVENLNDSEDVNRAWKNIRENIKISTKETLGLYTQKQHKPWFDEECSQVLGQRKQAKM
jgi:hypothetical protein